MVILLGFQRTIVYRIVFFSFYLGFSTATRTDHLDDRVENLFFFASLIVYTSRVSPILRNTIARITDTKSRRW